MFRALMSTGLLAMALSATISLTQTSARDLPATGSVRGTVIDADGRPVAGASVFVARMSTKQGAVPMGGRFPMEGVLAQTDGDGNFLFSKFPVAYNVSLDAYKESDGYPSKLGSFYAYMRTKASPPSFDVSRGQNVQGIVIRFAPKAAYLQFDITDESGGSVNGEGDFLLAGPDLSRPDRPFSVRTSVGSKDTMPVPSAPFWLSISAPGYRPWHYGGQDWRGRAGLISLKPGETLTVAISLRKAQ